MKTDFSIIIDKLLEMNPDPIPQFVLLKCFKENDLNDKKYQNLYKQVCNHPFVRKIEESQNERGFWHPFHGFTEGIIRKCISYGLDKNHICLKNVSKYLVKVLQKKEEWDQFEKQDNIRWWPEMFVPLVSSAALSMIDPYNKTLETYRQTWAGFAETAFKNGVYDFEALKNAQYDYFGFKTKRIIPPFNYYSLILLSPNNGNSYIKDSTDQALIDYCMNDKNGIYYVYNKKPADFVAINAQNKDSRDFWRWIRALSLISRFRGWAKYEQKYSDWIMKQQNQNGLWEFPKKFGFTLSNLWRGNNKVIDSTIFVLRLLMKGIQL
jgi:hypothetical protein